MSENKQDVKNKKIFPSELMYIITEYTICKK